MLRKKSYLTMAAVALLALLVPILTSVATGSYTFEPSANNKLLLIGQDIDSFDDYVAGVNVVPGGHVTYTSIGDQEGIHSAHDNGAGYNYLDYLVATYPDSAIEVAIWMKGQEQVICDNGTWGKVKNYTERMDTLIATLVAYDKPVYLRWGYEVDGPWNEYEPTPFICAWQKMWDRIQANNAQSHIAMVWQVASWCDGTYGGLPIDSWWPGDQYVDWVGLSYFTPQDCNWEKVDEAAAFAQAHNKPLMICESTPQRYEIADLTYSPNVDGTGRVSKTAQEIWDEWFVPYFNFINANNVRAVTYINADWDSQRMWGPPYRSGYWGDSRVQANPTILANWLSTIDGTEYLNASPTLFDDLGYGGVAPTNTPSGPTDTPAPTNTPQPTSTPGGTVYMHVENLVITNPAGDPWENFMLGDYVHWKVQILDQDGFPVVGATVVTEMRDPNGALKGTKTKTTGSDGWAIGFNIHSIPNWMEGTYTVSATNVTKSGATYDPGANVTDSDTCTLSAY